MDYIVSILITLDIARAFGKSDMFAIVGLLVFSPIGYAILAFGSAVYTNPHAISPVAPPPAAPLAPPMPPAQG